MISIIAVEKAVSLSKAKAFAEAALASHAYYSLWQGAWLYALAYAAAAAAAYAKLAAAWAPRK